MVYNVVVCPNHRCRGISIIDGRPETATCRQCSDSHRFKKYHVSYRADTHENAVKARTKLFIKLKDVDEDFEKLVEDGIFEEQEKIFNKSEEKTKADNLSPIELITVSVEKTDKAYREDVIDKAVDFGMDRSKAEKTIDKMINGGYFIRNGGKLELL